MGVSGTKLRVIIILLYFININLFLALIETNSYKVYTSF